LKNAPGAPKDTPEYVQRMMIQRDLRLLREAGIAVEEGARVEINPRFALDAEELKRRWREPGPIRGERYLSVDPPAGSD
jgi:hypothetical protein